MTEFSWLFWYCLLIVGAALFGAKVPFIGQVTHSRLQAYLSLSAGVMLGAAFFHVMPDAVESAGESFGWWMALGAVGLFCIERFIAPHSHEVSSKLQPEHAHEPGCEHDHEHRAAPALAGWMAVIGLTIHTFVNGVGLAGSVEHDLANTITWPGWAMFLAVVLHKPADAMAISTVLSRKGVTRFTLWLVQVGFAITIPIGAAVFVATSGAINDQLRTQLIGAALAFSSGTFLFIALSDLLPEVQFHSHDRLKLLGALVVGVLFMGFIAILEGGHDHGDHKHANHTQDKHERPHQAGEGNGKGTDHDHEEKDHDHKDAKK